MSILEPKFLHMRSDPQKTEFIYKKLCILTCLNFSHLQSTLHLMQSTYGDVFPLFTTVFDLIDFDAF